MYVAEDVGFVMINSGSFWITVYNITILKRGTYLCNLYDCDLKISKQGLLILNSLFTV